MLDFVVFVGVKAEVLELLGGHRRYTSDLLRLFQLLRVIVCVGTENPDLYLASRHGLLGVYNDSERRVLNHLLLLLCLHVNTRQPAPVTRVRMVPAHYVLGSRH